MLPRSPGHKPEPTNVIPLIPGGQGLNMVGKQVPLYHMASSFIDRGALGQYLPTNLPARCTAQAADEASARQGEQSVRRAAEGASAERGHRLAVIDLLIGVSVWG